MDCYELAKSFLMDCDFASDVTEDDIVKLAKDIQHTIESGVSNFERICRHRHAEISP